MAAAPGNTLPRLARLLIALLVVSASCATAPRAGALQPGPAAPPARHASAAAIAEYVRARLAAGAGDHASAIDALRQALVADPDSPQLRIAYADALSRAGQLDRAEGEARRAVELAPAGAAAADAHLVLGKVLALAARPAAAERELQTAARLEGERYRARAPDDDDDALDPDAWRTLARVQVEQGDAAAAHATCEALGALDAAEGAGGFRELGARLLDARDPAAAARELRRAIDLAPADADGWKLLAAAEEARDRLDEARKAWERALAADPDDQDALLGAGQLALRQNDASGARAWLRQLVRTASDETAARVKVSTVWLDARQPADALDVTAGSDDPRLLYLRGVALQQLRRWDDAASTYGRVKPGADVFTSARVSLGYVLGRAGKPDEAVRAVRRGLDASPREPSLLFALGEAYDRAGQHDAAIEQMRAVLAVKADHPEALNYLGYSYAERGEHLEEAQALIERALVLDPDNGYYLDSLGWVLFKRGDAARAVKTLERAAERVGPEATVLEHLGDAYLAARRPADAATAYRRALEAYDHGGADGDSTPGARAALERKLQDTGSRELQPVTSRR